MIKTTFTLIKKENLHSACKTWRLEFEGPEMETQPGQFVNIAVEGKYLRRPISICEQSGSRLTLIIDAVGEGTRKIVSSEPGTKFDMLAPLGNSFNLRPEKKKVILIGGGVGYAPLVGLLKKIVGTTDIEPLAIFGFNGGADVPSIHINEIKDAALPVEICTITGESGKKGNAIEVAFEIMKERNFIPEFFYTCGPMPMMNAVSEAFNIPGQLSLEARMGCGFGACMGCTIETASGPKRICREGPVFYKDELKKSGYES